MDKKTFTEWLYIALVTADVVANRNPDGAARKILAQELADKYF